METTKATSFYSGNSYMPQCAECKKKFMSPEAFEKHKASFNFKCQYCGVKFERAENQLSHVETHMISCFSCPKKFPNESQLKTHVNNLHRFACPECSEDCGSEANLGKHTVKKHMFPCQECKETLKTEEAFQAHMQSLHGANLKTAAEPSQAPSNAASSESFANTSENQQEGTQNPDNPKIHCQFCNKEFTDREVWKKHEEEESMVDIGSSIVDVATNEEMDMSEFFLPNTDAPLNSTPDSQNATVIVDDENENDENNTRFHHDAQWENVKHFYVEEKTVTARKLEQTYRELQRINNLQVKKLEASDLKNLPIARTSHNKRSKEDLEISDYKRAKYQLPNFAHLGITIAKSGQNDQNTTLSGGEIGKENPNEINKENDNNQNSSLYKAVKKIEDKDSSVLEDADDIIDNDLDTTETDAFNAEAEKEAERQLRMKWMHKMRTKVRCDECKKIVSQFRLEYHKKFHTDRIYRCPICCQGFLSRKKLSVHKYKKYLWTASHKTIYNKKEKLRSKYDTFTMRIVSYPQHKILSTHFKTFPFLTKKKADEISEQTELPLKAIQKWFEFRRLKNNISENAWKDMIASQPPSSAPNSAAVGNTKIDKKEVISSTAKPPPVKQKKPVINYKNYKGVTTGAKDKVPIKTYRGPPNQSNSIRPNQQMNQPNYQAGLNQGAFLNQVSVKQESVDVDNYQGPMIQGPNGAMMRVPMMQGPNGQMMQGANGQMMQGPNGQMMQGPNGLIMQGPNGLIMQGPNGLIMQGPNGVRMQADMMQGAPIKQEAIDVDNYAVGTDYDLLITARFNALQKTYQSLYKTFTDLKQAPLVGQPNLSQNSANSRPIISYNNPGNQNGNPAMIPKRPVQILNNVNPITKQPNQKILIPVRVQGNSNPQVNTQVLPLQSVNLQNIQNGQNMLNGQNNINLRSVNMPNNIRSMPGNGQNNVQLRPGNMPNNMTSMPGNMASRPNNMPNNIPSKNPPSLPSFLRQSNAPNGGPMMNSRNIPGNTSIERNLSSNGFGNNQQQFTKSFLSNLDKINGTNLMNPPQQQQQQNPMQKLQRINIVPKTINVMSNHPKVQIYKKNIIPS